MNSLLVTRFKPTVFNISSALRKDLRKSTGDGNLYYALDRIRDLVIKEEPKTRTVKQFFKDLLRPSTEFFIFIDKNSKNEVVLNTMRKINDVVLLGKEIPLNLEKIAKSKKAAIDALNESKSGILSTIKKMRRDTV